MKVVLLIPARYDSSRLPGKPLVLIAGKPMIQRVYEQALKVQGITEIYVATDDERVKNTIDTFGGNVVMTDKNAASGTDRIQEAITLLGLKDDDLIINLQGDQPLIDPRSLEQLIQLFERHPNEFSMATLAFKMGQNAQQHDDCNQVKLVFDNNFNALYFSRTKIPFARDNDDYPVYKHIGVYAYTRKFISTFAQLPQSRLEKLEKLEQLRALEHGYKIRIAISDFDSPEVDVPNDVDRCEALIAIKEG